MVSCMVLRETDLPVSVASPVCFCFVRWIPLWRDGDCQKEATRRSQADRHHKALSLHCCLAFVSECLAKAGPSNTLRLVSSPYAVAGAARDILHEFLSGSFSILVAFATTRRTKIEITLRWSA